MKKRKTGRPLCRSSKRDVKRLEKVSLCSDEFSLKHALVHVNTTVHEAIGQINDGLDIIREQGREWK